MSDADVEMWGLWNYPKGAGDRTWEWDKFHEASQEAEAETECYAIAARAELQGLMQLSFAGHESPGGQALVVDYLATSPANRGAGLRYAGVALVALAVHRSKEAGHDGRIWLESLPNAEDFYKRCGFERLPQESEEGNATYWLGSDAADALVRMLEVKGVLRVAKR